CISMGISGLGVITNIEEIRQGYEHTYHVPTIIDSDANIALYSIVTDLYDQGILVLSGTGSAVFGIHYNETILVGGFGHMLTEVGSAFTTVRDLMCQSIHQYESDQTLSPLTQAFFKTVEVHSIYELRSFVYSRTKREIAAYAYVVSKMAESGNLEAIDLLKKAGRDLAIDVKKAYKSLRLTEDAVIGFRGGFILNALITQEELLLALAEDGLKLKVVDGDLDPILGVYYKVKRMNLLC
ncbi:MAG: BadF/BadG/BcrA/BcrD ATPase family protein, partial [Bacilli bacterium]